MKPSTRALIISALALLHFAAAHALPIIAPAPIAVTSEASQYKVGFSLDPSNAQSPVYRFFSEKLDATTWGPWTELKIDSNPVLEDAAFKDSVNRGTVRLNEWGNQGGTQFAGDAMQLQTKIADFAWNYGYNIGFDNASIEVDLEVRFDWSHSAITDVAIQSNMAKAWESNIEQWWNSPDAKVAYTDAAGGISAYPIRFDFTLGGYTDGAVHNAGVYDQVVAIWDPASTDPNKPGGANMSQWFDTSSAQTAAHEFGHMLGLFDEYWGGGVNTATYAVDYIHLMGSYDTLAIGDGMKISFYQPFLKWFANKNPGLNFSLVLIEPPTMLLLTTILAIVGCYSRRSGASGRTAHAP